VQNTTHVRRRECAATAMSVGSRSGENKLGVNVDDWWLESGLPGYPQTHIPWLVKSHVFIP